MLTPTLGYYNNNIPPTPAFNYNWYPNTTIPNFQPQVPQYHQTFTPIHYNPHGGKRTNSINATTTANQSKDRSAHSLPRNSKNKSKAKSTAIVYSPLSKHIGIFEAENSKVAKPAFGGYKQGDRYTTPTSEGRQNANMFDNMSPLSDYNWKGGYPPGCTPTSQELADNGFATPKNATPPPLDTPRGDVKTAEGTHQHHDNASQLARGESNGKIASTRNTTPSGLFENNSSNPSRTPSPLSHDGRDGGTAAPRCTPTSFPIEKKQPQSDRAHSKSQRKSRRNPGATVPTDSRSTSQPAEQNAGAADISPTQVLGQSALVGRVYGHREADGEDPSPTIKSEGSPWRTARFALAIRPYSACGSDARSPKMELGFICHRR
ncbi:uncharacterized protein F4812DRAFT_462925 [Daldinia caldariorum]|uniref:uncharacterized protein n=1 Tax=Daldinia caldariorum TaxID=326644 RepID=UPI002008A412|nr:uncharacterized protein F4812DRAFT_462925 [Daldinia caldariorum]KAI1464175.1 hypothetical protein F4812DRAFT_462925 [Daldinia caldariorum]